MERATYLDGMHDDSIINSFVCQIIGRIDIRLVSNSAWLHMLCPILKEKSSTIICSLKIVSNHVALGHVEYGPNASNTS